jgi:hypothetical protein
VEQELLTFPGQVSSPLVFIMVRVALSYLCSFSFLPFPFAAVCCLPFILRLLIAYFVSSNVSNTSLRQIAIQTEMFILLGFQTVYISEYHGLEIIKW